MRQILVFGAGKSATVLIDFLITEAPRNNWFITIADVNREQVLAKTKGAACTVAVQVDINDAAQRNVLVAGADLVISMMPPALHCLIAKDCLQHRRHLLTASYRDAEMQSLDQAAARTGLLFLCEMGLDPGIDHMSAMQLIDEITGSGGTVHSFQSHCGGLVAPASDDNPWHYKISWNPRNIVLAGRAGAAFQNGGEPAYLTYDQLFESCREVVVPGYGQLAAYPNRDSLAYLPLYGLGQVRSFVRTTLRHPDFCVAWNALVKAGLTSEAKLAAPAATTLAGWSAPVLPFVNGTNEPLLAFLGLFSQTPLPSHAKTSADVLQWLLETRLSMQPHDKDLVIMVHELGFKKNNRAFKMESTLIVEGTDSSRTAMAKTVGLPLGIATRLILAGSLNLAGVQIPTHRMIYEPVLKGLGEMGILFNNRQTDEPYTPYG